MEKYEELWNKKKAAIAERIIKSANAQTAYSYAKELAEMELSEHQNDGCVLDNREPQDSIEALFSELAKVAEPVAMFLRKNFDPYATVVITDCFVKVVADEAGMPLKEEKE